MNQVMETEENINKKGKNNKYNFILDWIIPIVIALVVALLIKNYLLFMVSIPSGSMAPTLNEGDRLFVTKIYNLDNIKRGDIIVFKSRELDDTLIKRVIGLPGDVIKIVAGKVYVNNEEIVENYVVNTNNGYGEYSVPDGKYFFLGDDRRVSYDSTRWVNPYIDQSDIMAKAQIKVFPLQDFGLLK